MKCGLGMAFYAALVVSTSVVSGAQSAATVTALNEIQMAGPGATPTIDQAVVACGSNPCMVVISPEYTGAESSNLVTTSMGYQLYAGADSVNVLDLRADTGYGHPIYSMKWGGRTAGSLNGFSTNKWTGGAIPDSTSGGFFANWIQGGLPASGDQFGLTAVVVSHDSMTVGTSAVRLAAIDAEAIIDNTTNDAPLPDVRGVTAKIHMTRANAAQDIITATAFEAQTCTNDASGSGTFTNCYGFRAEPQGQATSRNYGFYNQANWLTDNDKYFDVLDSLGRVKHTIFFRSNNTIEYRPLANAKGWNWLTEMGNGIMSINDVQITLRKPVQIGGGVTIGSSGSSSAGHAMCWKDAHTLGYCTNTVDGTGTCACD